MTREIVFDTETTGFEYAKGERLVEIGAVELINHVPTGVTYHQYINPEKEVPEDAFKVHGLSYEFLKDYPTFDKIAEEWLDFIGDATLVAHNASFDINFVNYELKQIGKTEIKWDRVVDTLEIARALFVIWMRCANVLRLTIPAVRCTERCLMLNCWPKFIWNC